LVGEFVTGFTYGYRSRTARESAEVLGHFFVESRLALGQDCRGNRIHKLLPNSNNRSTLSIVNALTHATERITQSPAALLIDTAASGIVNLDDITIAHRRQDVGITHLEPRLSARWFA